MPLDLISVPRLLPSETGCRCKIVTPEKNKLLGLPPILPSEKPRQAPDTGYKAGGAHAAGPALFRSAVAWRHLGFEAKCLFLSPLIVSPFG